MNGLAMPAAISLAGFANLLRNAVRPGDLVARYGGEEFSAILAGVDVREGERIAERVRSLSLGCPSRFMAKCSR